MQGIASKQFEEGVRQAAARGVVGLGVEVWFHAIFSCAELRERAGY